MSRDALRERVLDEGSAMLSESGVTASLYHVNMEELIRRVGVPRSSAFAAFGGKEELITELMIRLLRPDPERPTGYSPTTTEIAESIIGQYADRMNKPDGSPDPEGRYAVLRESVRIVLSHNVDAMMQPTGWQTFLALSASAPSLPDGRRERVLAALRAADNEFTEAMVTFYAHAFGMLGRRMRPGLEWRHLVTAGAGVVEGIMSRRRIGAPIADEVVVGPGLDGEPVEWTVAAVAYLAIVEGMTEPVD